MCNQLLNRTLIRRFIFYHLFEINEVYSLMHGFPTK